MNVRSLQKSNKSTILKRKTVLSEVLNALCVYHQQQLTLLMKFLMEEQKACSDICHKRSFIYSESDLSNRKENSPTFICSFPRRRLTRRYSLKGQESSGRLPCLSVCLKDLRLTCPNLALGTVKLDSNKNEESHLKHSDHALHVKNKDSRGKRQSSLSSDVCDLYSCTKGKNQCQTLSPQQLSEQNDVADLNGTIRKSPLKSSYEQSHSLLSVTDKYCKNKLDSSLISKKQKRMTVFDETESSSILQQLIHHVNETLKDVDIAKIDMCKQKLTNFEQRQIKTVASGNLIRQLIKNIKQTDYSFLELLSDHEKRTETKMIQTRFRKRQDMLLSVLNSPACALSRHRSFKIKRKLRRLIEMFKKKNTTSENNSKKSSNYSIKKRTFTKGDTSGILSFDGSVNTHTLASNHKDVTKLPHYNLRLHSKNVNYSKHCFCLPDQLTMQKHTEEKKNVKSHIGSETVVKERNSSKEYCRNVFEISKQKNVPHEQCSENNSDLFCKCTTKQISVLLKDRVENPKSKGTIDTTRKTHLHVVVHRLQDCSNESLSKQNVSRVKIGKVHNPVTQQNTYRLRNRKADVPCLQRSLLLKPLNKLPENNFPASRSITNENVIHSASWSALAKTKPVRTSNKDTSATLPFTRYSSPIKLMFVSKVNGADGEKYALSSDYIASNNRFSHSLKNSVYATSNQTQVDITSDYCSQSTQTHSSLDKPYSYSSRTNVAKVKESKHETTEKAHSKEGWFVKRKPGRPKKKGPQALKLIRRPICRHLKSQVNFPVHTLKPSNVKSGIRLLSSRNKKCAKGTVKAKNKANNSDGRPQTVKGQILKNTIHTEAIHCKQTVPASSSSKRNILVCDVKHAIVTRSKSAELHSKGSAEIPAPTKNVQKSRRSSQVKNSGMSMATDCVSPQGKRGCFINSSSTFDEGIMIRKKDQKWECGQADHKLCNKKNLCETNSSLFRRYRLSRHTAKFKKLCVLHSISSLTTFSFRSALLHNSNKICLNKCKVNKRKWKKKNKACELPSTNSESLKRTDDYQTPDIVYYSTLDPAFHSNTILKWWPASISYESLLKDLDNRYEIMTNTWLDQNNIEDDKDSEIQSSSALEPCVKQLKQSSIQMLFQKKCNINDLSTWFMQTTESQSLSIVRKANARSPSNVNNWKSTKSRAKQSHINSSDFRKQNRKCTHRTSSEEHQCFSKFIQPERSTLGNIPTLAIGELKNKNVRNLNNLQSVVLNAEDVNLKVVCPKETIEVINGQAVKVPEKCKSITKEAVLPVKNYPKDNPGLHPVQLSSALVCFNTNHHDHGKYDSLLENAQETKKNKTSKSTNIITECRTSIKNLGNIKTKTSHGNLGSLTPVINSTAPKVNKCILRSDLALKNHPSIESNNDPIKKSLLKPLNAIPRAKISVHKKMGNKMCLRKSQRLGTKPIIFATLFEKSNKRKRCESTTACRETNTKKPKRQHSVSGKAETDYAKFQLGPLKPVGLTSLRGLSSQVSTFSLAPIRIPYHGSKKRDRDC